MFSIATDTSNKSHKNKRSTSTVHTCKQKVIPFSPLDERTELFKSGDQHILHKYILAQGNSSFFVEYCCLYLTVQTTEALYSSVDIELKSTQPQQVHTLYMQLIFKKLDIIIYLHVQF